MNPFLTSTVRAYKRFNGKTLKPVVWEVGSRDGHDAVELASRIYGGSQDWFWANATIVCLEPNPDQLEVIHSNYPEVETVEYAASNKDGKADFIVYEGDEGAVGSSSLNLKWKDGDLEGHIIQVKTARLDKLIGDQLIDIMKIDVEGHSLEVLEGIGSKLNQIKVIHVETETWTGSDKKVRNFMKKRGWILVDQHEQYGGMPDQVWVAPIPSDSEE